MTNVRGISKDGISSGEISDESDPMICDSVQNHKSKRAKDHSEKVDEILSESEKKKCNKEDWVIHEDSRRLKIKKKLR